ncbi:DUF7002 family protein [Paenibacillus nicotianae]|uniref:DUF7002 family protein n=1 Tax=Paenibacillus nicotianae TaxID=1526551 RepID=A0ABW4US91_9BACL
MDKLLNFENKFIKSKPYLFHVTRMENFLNIMKLNALISVNEAQKHIITNNLTAQSISSKRYINTPQKVLINKNSIVTEYYPNTQINIQKKYFLHQSNTFRNRFYLHLDNHVFLWADEKYKENMLKSYSKYDMVTLKLNTAKLLNICKGRIYVSKFNSGSNPQYNSLSKKSRKMFIPLRDRFFKREYLKMNSNIVPRFPSQVKEILIKEEIPNLIDIIEEITINKKSNFTKWHNKIKIQ